MRTRHKNYDLWAGFSRFIPNGWNVVSLLLFLFAGNLIASLLVMGFQSLLGYTLPLEYQQLIAEPVMFLFPMFYALSKSHLSQDEGYAINSRHFGSTNGFVLALLCIVAVVGSQMIVDPISSAMPPMPKWLEDMLGSLTGGNFWINFLMVCVFAPVFEEWLFRGEILRGLLNHRRKDGSKGINPGWAISISAALFAFIHLNPWQAIPAFLLGLLFGWVYYKTGSLSLTMLMHSFNNGIALCVTQFSGLDNDVTFRDLLPLGWYIAIIVVSVAFVWWFCRHISRIPSPPNGNCDRIPSSWE